MHDKFGLAAEVGNDGKKFVVKNTDDEKNSQSLVLRLNDFPYCFDETVQHYCLWKLGDEVDEDDIVDAMRQLKKSKIYTEYTYYINPPNLKSILEVSHAHILIKVEPDVRAVGVIGFFQKVAQRLQCKKTRKVLLYSSLGIGLFGASIALRICYQARLFVTDAQDILHHVTIRKLFRFYVNYFAPFPIAMILKYSFPAYHIKR